MSRPWLVSIAYTDLPSDARVIREAREATTRGAEVTLVVPRSSNGRPPFQLDGVEIVWLPVDQERGQTTLAGQLRFMRLLARWRAEQTRRPDVVHIHNMPDYLYWAVSAWHRAGARVVLDVHDIMSHVAEHRFAGPKRRFAMWALGRTERSIWHRVDHIITVHEPYRDAIVGTGIPGERVSVVLNSPDPSVVRPELRRRPQPGVFKIVFHGSVTGRSGIVHAVRAMKILLRRVPEARLLVIGAGDASEDVHRAIAELGLMAHVTFIPRYLPLPEVVDLIADANAAVVPNELSRFTELMLPVKFLEYATLGIPSVATCLPLLESYVGHQAAHLIEKPDPGLIAEGLARLARDPDYSTRLSGGARRFIETHGWGSYADVLVSALGVS